MRIWLLLLFVIGLLLLLKWQFPYAVGNTDQQLQMAYMAALIVMIGGGSGMLRRMKASQVARDILLWVGIILLLVFGYSFRGELKNSRVYGELVPSHIQQTSEGSLSVDSSEDGHFHMEAEVNGVLLKFLVDTGASDIVLSPRDAEAAGYDVTTLNYSRHYNTANGMVSGAPVRIQTMLVGPVTLRDLPASVNGAAMDESLLGMGFLKQFKSYNVDGNRLTLYP